MPLLRNGELVDGDPWSVITDDADLPENPEHVLVSLERFLGLLSSTTALPGGVVVSPAEDVLSLAPHVQQLKLIGIDFPAYTDGRGYSHARLLRKRLNYSGELRALGDVRADSVLFMLRMGFDSFNFDEKPDSELLESLTMRYEKNYQPSYVLPSR